MKKTILIVSAISIAISSNIALASNFRGIIPANTDAYLEFNTTEKNPLQELLTTAIPKQFGETIFSDTEDQTQKDKVIKAYSDILANNILGMSLGYPGDFSVGLKITDIQYQNFLEALGTKATVAIINPKIYQTRDDFFFTKSNDLFLAAPTKEKLLSLLNTAGEKLNTNTEYKKISSEFKDDDTLTLFLSSTIFKNIFNNNPFFKNSPDINIINKSANYLKAFGFTLKKTNTGLNTKIIIASDPEEGKKQGYDTNSTPFTPLLYKLLPSENPIFYIEFSNLKNETSKAIKLLDKSGKINLDNYLSLLGKETAIYIQKDDQVFPAVTIVFNTSNNKKFAIDIVSNLAKLLESVLKIKNIQYGQVTNKGLTSYTFDLNDLDSKMKIPHGMNKFSITMGVTPENYLLFSTYSNIGPKYGEGLQKNSAFQNALPNLKQEVAGIAYLNIKNLAAWGDQFLSTAEEISDNAAAKSQIDETRNLLKKIQLPWQDLGIINRSTPTLSTLEINLNFDFSSINMDYLQNIEDLSKSIKLAFKTLKKSHQTFSDTTPDDWYYQDIQDLNTRGIIKGYEDKSFKPNNTITRAEFLTMLIRALDSNYINEAEFKLDFDNIDNHPDRPSSLTRFNDVDKTEWYSDYTLEGRYLGIISGYDGNNFHPNKEITRAEAISILNKMIDRKFDSKVKLPVRAFSDPFTDVNPSDWYYDDVQRIYGYSIIDGNSNTQSFYPNRSLTRAEAAKIINKTLQEIDNLPAQTTDYSSTNFTKPTFPYPELGDSNAPVVIQEFSDYQCPACQYFHNQSFPVIKQKYIDTGKVRFEYFNFPLTTIHENAYNAAKFAECSYQDYDSVTFLKIQDKLYTTMTNGKFDYNTMSDFAATIGINKDSLKKCFDDDKYKDEIASDIQFAEEIGINGTPGFIVNGSTVIGSGPELEKIIDEKLAQSETK